MRVKALFLSFQLQSYIVIWSMLPISRVFNYTQVSNIMRKNWSYITNRYSDLCEVRKNYIQK